MAKQMQVSSGTPRSMDLLYLVPHFSLFFQLYLLNDKLSSSGVQTSMAPLLFSFGIFIILLFVTGSATVVRESQLDHTEIATKRPKGNNLISLHGSNP